MKSLRRILILDDELAFREVLTSELVEEGYEVRSMESKREAYDVLLYWKPDMIITDIASPEMDGWQFLKWVRVNPFAARLRLIVATGQTGLKISAMAAELGVLHVVNKPYDLKKLLETIRRQFAKQDEPVWQLPESTINLFGTGPAHAMPWNLLVERWQEALVCSPYRTAVLGMADWRLDFVVDDGVSLTVGRMCRPVDPGICYSARRYHGVLDGYGVENGLFFLVCPPRKHLPTSPRAVIVSPEETEEIFSTGLFAPDLKRFES